MGRKKQSIIWNISLDDFKNLITKSSTYKEILTKIGLRYKSGGSYKTLQQRVILENIDVSHIEIGKKTFRGQSKQKPLNEMLILGVGCSNSALKKRLLNDGILENKCSECGQLPVWNGKPLVLQLDHINGNHNDNRIENLRILCPHCYTQTETYGRKNVVKTILESDFCKCGLKKSRNSNCCRLCSVKEKIVWPDNDALQVMLLTKPTSQIAIELGVSDVAISKRAKRFGLQKPKRGFWTNIERTMGNDPTTL